MIVLKSTQKLFVLICAAGLFASCAVNVRTVYDHDANFDSYKTFCWMDGCEFKVAGPEYLKDSMIRDHIKLAIISELKRKGLTQNLDNPDLLVGFNITMKDEKAIIYHHSPDMPFYRPVDNDSDVIPYLKGTLVLGMADKKQSKIVWESFAVSYLDMNPDFSEEEVLKGIKLVLRKFPPKK